MLTLEASRYSRAETSNIRYGNNAATDVRVNIWLSFQVEIMYKKGGGYVLIYRAMTQQVRGIVVQDAVYVRQHKGARGLERTGVRDSKRQQETARDSKR